MQQWLTDRGFFKLAVVFYGVSMMYSLFLWRRGFQKDDRANYALLLTAFGLHTIALLQRGYRIHQCPVTNLFEVTTFVAWVVAAAYLVIGLMPRLRFLGAFASPLLFAVGIFALFPQLDGVPRVEFAAGIGSLHVTLIVLAYGAFGLGSAAAMMYLSQERDLKIHKLRAVIAILPSIQRLEKLIERLIIAGLVLLTGGLTVGGMWLQRAGGGSFWSDPKVIWSALVWAAYLTMLVAHFAFAQRGRRFAWATVACFIFLITTFWGVNLLSPIHNP